MLQCQVRAILIGLKYLKQFEVKRCICSPSGPSSPLSHKSRVPGPCISVWMVGKTETENERLNALESRILQKYGATSADLQNTNLSSICSPAATTPVDHSSPNLQATGAEVLSAGEQSASSKISICSHCAGVGKLYESMAVGGPEGIRRVLESCCTACNGMCYITNEEVSLSLI